MYDITRAVRPGIAVWPGDTAYQAEPVQAIERGDSTRVSRLTLSSHTGTHADAPSHTLPDGAPSELLPLDAYLGPCWVVTVDPAHPQVRHSDLRGLNLGHVPRVLFRTRASRLPDDVWDDGFVSISPDAARLLVAGHVRLVGIDTPSVDPSDSRTLEAHRILFTGGVSLLEGITLRDVPDGIYDLVALPMRMDGLDAVPVRAVLRPLAPDALLPSHP